MDKPIRILVESEEGAFLEQVHALLEGADGITTVERQAGLEIVDQVQELGPDLILLDLDIGSSYPPDVVSTIRRHHPDVKIVVASSPGQEGSVLHALRSGASGHVVKGGSDRVQLIADLRAVSQGESILSPAVAGMILDEMAGAQRLNGRLSKTSAGHLSPLV